MFATEQCTPSEEIQSRLRCLRSALAGREVDAALIFQKMDLFYFSGTIQQGQLYVPADGEPVLMVRKSAERAQAESPVANQVFLEKLEQMRRIVAKQSAALPRRIGLELDVIPAKLYLSLGNIFPEAEFVDVSDEIRTLRAVKSVYEIARIKEAARCADRVAAFVADELKEGMSEVELAGRVEAEARRLGHQGFVRMRLWDHELFYGHLMAGPGAAVPSYLASPTGGAALSPAVAQGASLRPIRAREPVLVDYVFAKDGYLADHTRIFAVRGLDDDLMQAHQTALDIQTALVEQLQPGTVSGALYEKAVSLAADRGYAAFFMGAESSRIRFVGHGIGLELDEFPFLAKGQDRRLESGMTIALEPKMVIPGRGVVGIENTHVVTEQGSEQITRFSEAVTII